MRTPLVTAVTFGTSLLLILLVNPAEAQDKDLVAALDASCFASIVTGSGINTFNVCISDTGRVTQVTSPAGVNNIFGQSGNYYLCDSRFGTYNGDGGAHFNSFSITQPNGPNTLPLTVISRTFDNLWQIATSFAMNKAELELVVTDTILNLGGAVAAAAFARYADTAVDNGDGGDIGDRSLSTVSVRDRPADLSTTGNMLTLTALTRTTPHATAVDFFPSVRGCNPPSAALPMGPADLGFNLTYNLGSVGLGRKKIVKFKFERR